MTLRDYASDEKAQRRDNALEMRRSGKDIEEIARKLNYPTLASCKQDLNRAFAEVLRTSKDEAKALDLLRLDRMILSLWPDARDGAVSAIDRVIKLIDMRAKFIGNYAPVQVEQLSLDAIENEIRELEKDIGPATRRALRKSRRVSNGQTSPSQRRSIGEAGTA